MSVPNRYIEKRIIYQIFLQRYLCLLRILTKSNVELAKLFPGFVAVIRASAHKAYGFRI